MAPGNNTVVTYYQRACLLVLALLLCAAAVWGLTVIRADWSYFKADKAMAVFKARVDRKGVADLKAGDLFYLESAQANIMSAISLWPANSDYLFLYSQVVVWQGYLKTDLDQQKAYYRHAAQLAIGGLHRKPSYAEGWAKLAEYKALAGERDVEMHEAREKALALGGANVALISRMMRL